MSSYAKRYPRRDPENSIQYNRHSSGSRRSSLAPSENAPLFPTPKQTNDTRQQSATNLPLYYDSEDSDRFSLPGAPEMRANSIFYCEDEVVDEGRVSMRAAGSKSNSPAKPAHTMMDDSDSSVREFSAPGIVGDSLDVELAMVELKRLRRSIKAERIAMSEYHQRADNAAKLILEYSHQVEQLLQNISADHIRGARNHRNSNAFSESISPLKSAKRRLETHGDDKKVKSTSRMSNVFANSNESLIVPIHESTCDSSPEPLVRSFPRNNLTTPMPIMSMDEKPISQMNEFSNSSSRYHIVSAERPSVMPMQQRTQSTQGPTTQSQSTLNAIPNHSFPERKAESRSSDEAASRRKPYDLRGEMKPPARQDARVVSGRPPSVPKQSSTQGLPFLEDDRLNSYPEFSLASNDHRSELVPLAYKYRQNYFSRKPRSAMFHPDPSSVFADILVTSSLAGDLTFADTAKPPNESLIAGQITEFDLCNHYSEDMCWMTSNAIAVAAASERQLKDNQKTKKLVMHQIALVHDISLESRSRLKCDLSYRIKHFEHEMPHQRGIASVVSVPSSGFRESMGMVVTGGLDRNLFLWNFKRDDSTVLADVSHSTLHSQHTSAVNDMYFNTHKNVLYSGGMDHRLCGFAFDSNKLTLHRKFDDKICAVYGIPTNPNLLLLNFDSTMCRQNRVFDSRVGDTVLAFGLNETETSGKYINPFIHPNGHIVAMGEAKDMPNPKLHLWDIRYVDVNKQPPQSLYMHDKRIMRGVFHPTKSSLFTISTDLSLGRVDFKI